MKKYDILVAGEINPDLILSDPRLVVTFGQHETLVDHLALTVGSSSVIFACGAARLGLQVGFVGVVGDDTFGRFMLSAMRERGVDTSHLIVDKAIRTGISVILAKGVDRAILTYPGAIAALTADQVANSFLEQAGHLHVASYFLQTSLQDGLPDLFDRAQACSLTTSLDSNWDPSGAWHGVDDLLQRVDVFLPNESEALAISKATNMDDALERLGRLCKMVAIKRGADGAVVKRGAETARAESLRVAVVDTVGAGDSFDAGFLYGFLRDFDLAKALQLACVCGSLSVQAAGGVDGQPTLDEAIQHMALI